MTDPTPIIPIPHAHDAPHAVEVSILDFADPMERGRIDQLMTACCTEDGHLPFGDHELLAIARGKTDGHVGMGVRDGEGLAAYGHLSTLGEAWFCEVAVRPDHRGHGHSTALLDAIVAHVAMHGGGTLSTWAYKMDGPTAALARHIGLTPVRTLFQLRLAPLPDSSPALPDGFTLDHFRVGQDEQEWLAFNAIAFAHLPDQGAWTDRDLQTRLSAAWFQERDMLIVRSEGQIVATCWCKLDPHATGHDGEQLGEIYVIAVDERYAGQGLGKSVVMIGLSHLRTRGAEAGMLYVDGRNTRALLLYDGIGFVTHHEDVCLSMQVEPATAVTKH